MQASEMKKKRYVRLMHLTKIVMPKCVSSLHKAVTKMSSKTVTRFAYILLRKAEEHNAYTQQCYSQEIVN